MAKNDITIVDAGAGNSVLGTKRIDVQDRTNSGASATIKPGEPIKRVSAGSPYAILCADGDPEIGTDLFLGIAWSESTETTTADGEVAYISPIPGKTIMRAKATTAGNVATTIKGDTVTFDLANGIFTVDENEGADDNVHGLVIEDVNVSNGTIDFSVKSNVMQEGSAL